MAGPRKAIFLIDLVQDVGVLRPLICMATRDFPFDTHLLVSRTFGGRDRYGIWQKELDLICEETGAKQYPFSSDWQAHQVLDGSGLIVAASESHLANHSTTHSIFRHVPPTFLRVTLQHGFECIGFLHSADHDRAHGETASFGADIVCAWSSLDKLSSMARSQFGKVHVTGPTAVLQQHAAPPEGQDRSMGLVCENLHSVRLSGAEHLKTEFEESFSKFCKALSRSGKNVILRPHPGGQYALKNWAELPGNVRLDLAPMYRLNLKKFAYGISGPSSVLLDLLLAEIPTAVWRDQDNIIDAANYEGLTTVSSPSEWLDFADAATADPRPFIELQRSFLRRQKMVIEPAEVFGRYAELFAWALHADLK